MFLTNRLKRVRDEILPGLNVEALVVLNTANLYYLSHFTPIEDYVTALVIHESKGAKLIVPRLELERAEEETKGLIDIIAYSKYTINDMSDIIKGDLLEAIVKVLHDMKVKSIGVEFNVPYSIIDGIRRKLNVRIVDSSKKIMDLRIVKCEDEIIRIEKAIKITEKALKAVLEVIRDGIRECEVAGIAEKTMRYYGAEYFAFPSIVASGFRGALPHATTSEKVIKRGELVVVDIGAKYLGYCGDLTRTIPVKPVSNEAKDVYYAVLEAQKAAIRKIKPREKAGEVDKAARDVLKEYGYDKYFIHSTGHGLGIEVHEPPRISSCSETILKPGMVFTVEPGVYIQGKLGVRIEDIALVTSTGCRILSTFTRDLI